MSSDEVRASSGIKRKVDGITADDEAIAVLDQNIKKSKTDQDEPGNNLIQITEKKFSAVVKQLLFKNNWAIGNKAHAEKIMRLQ